MLNGERNTRSQNLFVHLTVMSLTQWGRQMWVLVLASCVVCFDAENAGRNRESLFFTILLAHSSPRRSDWLAIPHAAPPLNAR